MLGLLCNGPLDADGETFEYVFGDLAGVFFKSGPISAAPRSISGMEGLRNSPPTDARGLKGLLPIVLLPDLMGVIFGVILTGVGVLSPLIEAGAGRVSLEGVTLERGFTLLLAFSGVFSDFVFVGPLNADSLATDDFGGLKVLVDAQKSIGTASPL
jgi:hypothetical protein